MDMYGHLFDLCQRSLNHFELLNITSGQTLKLTWI
jgi:hypothetical protein